jgi:hypothetical protein
MKTKHSHLKHATGKIFSVFATGFFFPWLHFLVAQPTPNQPPPIIVTDPNETQGHPVPVGQYITDPALNSANRFFNLHPYSSCHQILSMHFGDDGTMTDSLRGSAVIAADPRILACSAHQVDPDFVSRWSDFPRFRVRRIYFMPADADSWLDPRNILMRGYMVHARYSGDFVVDGQYELIGLCIAFAPRNVVLGPALPLAPNNHQRLTSTEVEKISLGNPFSYAYNGLRLEGPYAHLAGQLHQTGPFLNAAYSNFPNQYLFSNITVGGPGHSEGPLITKVPGDSSYSLSGVCVAGGPNRTMYYGFTEEDLAMFQQAIEDTENSEPAPEPNPTPTPTPTPEPATAPKPVTSYAPASWSPPQQGGGGGNSVSENKGKKKKKSKKKEKSKKKKKK